MPEPHARNDASVAFVGVMVAGGALGAADVPLPMVEPGILASVIVLGLLVLTAARLPVALGAVLVAAFALLHGHAHGAELPAEDVVEAATGERLDAEPFFRRLEQRVAEHDD